jgi:hypothetical protein
MGTGFRRSRSIKRRSLPGTSWRISGAPTPAELAAKLPFDPLVIVGQLENGLRYYIMENQFPAKRAELRLAVSVGSVFEADDHPGLTTAELSVGDEDAISQRGRALRGLARLVAGLVTGGGRVLRGRGVARAGARAGSWSE